MTAADQKTAEAAEGIAAECRRRGAATVADVETLAGYVVELALGVAVAEHELADAHALIETMMANHYGQLPPEADLGPDFARLVGITVGVEGLECEGCEPPCPAGTRVLVSLDGTVICPSCLVTQNLTPHTAA